MTSSSLGCISSMQFQRGALSGPNRMNETDARRVCESKFAQSSINNVTGKLISDEIYIDNCIFDLMVSKSIRIFHMC